ncbi:30S ribosomal protein S9 [Haliangium sp.]|uniref:30S ribosomal protein S9 n=1 Tax=Haliangium sp. TaxID=2663208 RepID=UPI003D124993
MAEQERTYATGRRKTAVARVWLAPGSGKFTINKRDDSEYFTRATARMVIRQPLEAISEHENYDVIATVKGGGTAAQAGALRHGITRALMEINPEWRPTLKSAGYVTRDPRKKERKKYGMKGARARFQFSKR